MILIKVLASLYAELNCTRLKKSQAEGIKARVVFPRRECRKGGDAGVKERALDMESGNQSQIQEFSVKSANGRGKKFKRERKESQVGQGTESENKR